MFDDAHAAAPGLTHYTAAAAMSLPSPVQRYLKRALVEGQPVERFGWVKQTALFKPAVDGKGDTAGWKQTTAEEFFAASPPAFVWAATIKMMPGLWMKGYDQYLEGDGRMQWRMDSVIPIVTASGPEVTVSSLLRYLSEVPFVIPGAFLPGFGITWEPVDDNSAQATITDSGITTTGVFNFNEQGEIVSFLTDDRYRTEGKKYVKSPWICKFEEWKEDAGRLVAVAGRACWELEPGKEFCYCRLRSEEVKAWSKVEDFKGFLQHHRLQ